MKDRGLKIIEALESMKAAERAADFEDLAGHIAKLRWPELVITERKSDGGEDLTSFSPGKDGKTRRVAISLTGTWAKVQADAQRQRQRGLQTDVLVFITPERLTNLVVSKWCKQFKQKFGHKLEVLTQAHLVSDLEEPENDWLCMRYLRLEPYQPDLKDFQNLLPALRPCLVKLAEDCQLVTLLGIDPQVGDVTESNSPELAKVYIQLNTTEARAPLKRAAAKRRARSPMPGTERETEPLPAVEAILSHDRSVFLGSPGSGKTTLFRYLAFCLARHHTEEKGNYVRDLPLGSWTGSPPVPVWVELRRLAAACKDQAPSAGDSCHIWNYLKAGLEKRNFSEAIPALEAALQHGHALVLLDGLDEVPDGQRAFIRQAIESFATGGFRASRMVATCRVKSYVPRGLQLKGFGKAFTLAEFTSSQSRQFVEGWYHECARKGYQGMTAEDAARCIPSLVKALDHPRLREMARNPMHLTAMACLHTARAGEPLPEESANLFDLLVNTLLFLWAKAKAKGAADATQDELGALLKEGDCSEKKLRASLERLAFQAHQAAAATQTGDWKPADITEDTLKLEFARLDIKGQRLDWAGKVIEAIRHRAGLLQSEDGKTFQFTYRFQEFLAGGYLADKDAWERDHRKEEARGQMPGFAKRAAALFDPAGYWRNVIIWAAGIRAHVKGDLGDVRDLVHELCQMPARPDASARRQLVFAADVVREVRFRELLELSWGKETVADLRQRLLGLLQSTAPAKEFPLKERAEVASQLGWVHDPREGVGTVARPGHKDRPDLLWTVVIEPDEPFTMGGKVPGWQDVAEFRHRLQHPFCVAVYPVTVAQFELFIQDGGYTREELWTKTGWQWREQQQRTRPGDHESVFQTPNHPRVGVTWYEAVAFCNWLNATFKPEELKLPEHWKVRLPSEAEWERAARHSDGRSYPWGNEEQGIEQRCNMRETRLGHTSAVGLFPRGKAVCGAHDLAGNVWEWTGSEYGDYPYDSKDGREKLEGDRARVLRGGSWGDRADDARCACRSGSGPGYRDGDVGFRVVASPFFALNSDSSEL